MNQSFIFSLPPVFNCIEDVLSIGAGAAGAGPFYSEPEPEPNPIFSPELEPETSEISTAPHHWLEGPWPAEWEGGCHHIVFFLRQLGTRRQATESQNWA